MMPAKFIFSEHAATVQLQGEWTVQGIAAVEKQLAYLPSPTAAAIKLDLSAITALDMAGALLLNKISVLLAQKGLDVTLIGVKSEQQTLLNLLAEQAEKIQRPLPAAATTTALSLIGKKTVLTLQRAPLFFAFLGETVVTLLRLAGQIKALPWRAALKTVETAGYHALPIIALLSFLIGVVITYQMGLQLRTYGANIYIVDLVGLAVLREFGPLITAIILAGRTSSAFTAELGTMKINEELDALQTMGIRPITLLVLPKLLAMLIVVPLLTVWADIFGVLGGMLMSKNILNINATLFFTRFEEVINLQTYWIGLDKTPVFALLITLIGCYQGFQVTVGAGSVGRQTTKSVVQAIFCIIVADALYSIYFSWKGL